MSLGSRAERRRWGPGAASLAVFAACAIQGAVGFVGPVRGPWGTHASLTRSQGFRWAASPSVQSAGAAKESQGVAESFVQTELRKAAMKLHTRDQAKEGEQEAQKPFTAWEPKRQDYLQFLVDSKLVYETFDDIIAQRPELAPFRNTGLERAAALDKDIRWFTSTHKDVTLPEVGPKGREYAQVIRDVADKSLPAFMCHFYNHYFAHTAGGRMIGKKMAAMLLDGHELSFYQWDGDVKELLEAVRNSMDRMAAGWSAEEKQQCVDETPATFKYGGSLLTYIAGPRAH